ncbi:MAG: hypothetical protein ACXABY_32070 [Candidatus Thorarchaeota archaeon]|jgi:hypothetical protein
MNKLAAIFAIIVLVLFGFILGVFTMVFGPSVAKWDEIAYYADSTAQYHAEKAYQQAAAADYVIWDELREQLQLIRQTRVDTSQAYEELSSTLEEMISWTDVPIFPAPKQLGPKRLKSSMEDDK